MEDRKKVIKGLEFTKAMITFNPSTGEDIEPENLNEVNKISYDACVDAVALLKQRKTVVHKQSRKELGVYLCPWCNEIISIGFADDDYRFCPYCGRGVKWNA